MKVFIFFYIFIALVISQDAKEISRKSIEAQRNFKDEKADMTLTLINEKGDKVVREMISLTLERENMEDYSIIQFLNPADVRGTGLLTYQKPDGDDKQWLYLPELRRVKRISSSNKSGSFMGSEFAYEDITGNTLEKYNYKYIGEENLEGEDCYIIERYPIYENSGYTVIKSWISKNTFLAKRLEYTDRKKSLLKVQTMKDWEKYDIGTYRVKEIYIKNLQTKKESILQFRNRSFGNKLSKRDFSKRKLERLIK